MRYRHGHAYFGEIIEPCEHWPNEHAGAWFIQRYHGPTGMPYADELCAHYRTLADAKEAVRELVAQREFMAVEEMRG